MLALFLIGWRSWKTKCEVLYLLMFTELTFYLVNLNCCYENDLAVVLRSCFLFSEILILIDCQTCVGGCFSRSEDFNIFVNYNLPEAQL